MADDAPAVDAPGAGWVWLCDADALQVGEVAEFVAHGVPVALARLEDGHRAVPNTCPHAGGPLGDGQVEGTVLRCPLHGWGFDLYTGICDVDPAVRVEPLPVRVQSGAVWLGPSDALRT